MTNHQQLIEEQGMRGILYIMRGCPGSGKSHLAQRLTTTPEQIISADQWFSPTDNYQEYRANWAVEKLFAAHNWCKSKVREALQRGVSPIVLDNTNIKRRDFMPYIDMAKQYRYLYEVRESDSPWWLQIKELLLDPLANQQQLDIWAERLAEGFEHEGKVIKNGHGVPSSAIKRMLYQMQPYYNKNPNTLRF